MNRSALCRAALLILAFLFLFEGVSCSSGDPKKQPVTSSQTTVLAVVSDPFSDAFVSSSANSIRASTPAEYAVGLLSGEPIMQKNPDGSYSERNGSIRTETVDGVTVATVRINNDVKYYSGQSVSISDYIALLQQITLPSNTGYFKDFYQYPILGLVAFRFKKRGLTLSDLPDFDAETASRLSSLTKEEYEQLLLKTSIAGLYDGNSSALNYDGKTFRETIETADRSLPAGFFGSASKEEILRRLAAILSARPRSEWILNLLSPFVYNDVVTSYRASLEDLKDAPSSIAGVSKINNYSCKITFEKIIDHNDAVAILNLPLIYSGGSRRAGAYLYKNNASGTVGSALSYVTKTSNGGTASLTVITADAESVPDSVALGQVNVAAFLSPPPDSVSSRVASLGLALLPVGSGFALFNPSVTSEDFVRSLAVFC